MTPGSGWLAGWASEAAVEEHGVTRLLDELASELREGRYRPVPAQRSISSGRACGTSRGRVGQDQAALGREFGAPGEQPEADVGAPVE